MEKDFASPRKEDQKNLRGTGSAGYHPALVLGLLVYGYADWGIFGPQAGAGDL